MILSQHSSLCACCQTFQKYANNSARRTEHWDYFRIRGNRGYHYYLDWLKVNGKRKRLFSTISSVPRSATNQALSGWVKSELSTGILAWFSGAQRDLGLDIYRKSRLELFAPSASERTSLAHLLPNRPRPSSSSSSSIAEATEPSI
jgi:hypothetical protein